MDRVNIQTFFLFKPKAPVWIRSKARCAEQNVKFLKG